MTLKYMQGFESMRDDSDFRTQGWITAPSSMTAGFTPSFTTVNGTSLQLIGSGNSSGLAPGSAGVADIGFFKTGVTVNQAWNSGGFALGLAARFLWIGRPNECLL
jgi:hypothetical protein